MSAAAPIGRTTAGLRENTTSQRQRSKRVATSQKAASSSRPRPWLVTRTGQEYALGEAEDVVE
jgi:hypothetical protein